MFTTKVLVPVPMPAYYTCTRVHTLTGLLLLEKNSGSEMGSMRKERAMLARRPLGASLVIFTPFCSTATGKEAAG